jgi:hypothetical protein
MPSLFAHIKAALKACRLFVRSQSDTDRSLNSVVAATVLHPFDKVSPLLQAFRAPQAGTTCVHLCTAAVAHQGQLTLASGNTSEEATERPLLTTEPGSSPSHSAAPSPLLTPPDRHLSSVVVVVSGSPSSSLTVVPPDSEPNVSKVGREHLDVGAAVSTPCHRMRAVESYDSSGASRAGLPVSSPHVENHPVNNGFLPPQPVYDRRRYRLPPPSIDMFAGAKLPGLDTPLYIWTRQIADNTSSAVFEACVEDQHGVIQTFAVKCMERTPADIELIESENAVYTVLKKAACRFVATHYRTWTSVDDRYTYFIMVCLPLGFSPSILRKSFRISILTVWVA